MRGAPIARSGRVGPDCRVAGGATSIGKAGALPDAIMRGMGRGLCDGRENGWPRPVFLSRYLILVDGTFCRSGYFVNFAIPRSVAGLGSCRVPARAMRRPCALAGAAGMSRGPSYGRSGPGRGYGGAGRRPGAGGYAKAGQRRRVAVCLPRMRTERTYLIYNLLCRRT